MVPEPIKLFPEGVEDDEDADVAGLSKSDLDFELNMVSDFIMSK